MDNNERSTTQTLTITEILKGSDYSLTIFTDQEVKAIKLFDRGGKPYLTCAASDKPRPAKPEEIVRQLYLRKLISIYGYPKDRIAIEKPVYFGSAVHEKAADIVVWEKDGGLNVRVNPELGLNIDGKKYIVKLYFKDEKPTKQRLKVVFEMMRVALPLDTSIASAVMDVSNGKLIIPKPLAENLLPLLEAQALAFVHLWAAVAPKVSVSN